MGSIVALQVFFFQRHQLCFCILPKDLNALFDKGKERFALGFELRKR